MVNNLPNWYVITGGPSSGKTTIIKKLAELGYFTFPEAARVFIDKEIARGKSLKEIRKNEGEFQKRVLKMKIKIEKEAPKDKIVFFDRGIPDSIAYFEICGIDSKEVLKFCKKKTYRKIFFFEKLPFKKDYARVENGKTIEKLNKLFKKSYKDLGYKIVNIPAMSVEKRVQKILSNID